MSSIQSRPADAPVTLGTITLPAFRARYARGAARLTLRYCCHGPASLPVVAVLGGISAHRVVTSLPDGLSGWWDAQVGPGRGIDTRRFRILAFDFITPRDIDDDCPAVSTADQADALAGLLNALGIRQLHALVGASYGAMVGLGFGARHGRRLRHLIAISGAHRAHPHATALRSIQRRIVRRIGGTDGVALARALAIVGYLTPQHFLARFGASTPTVNQDGASFAVDGYLAYNGGKLAAQWRADDYLALSELLDLHDVEPERITVPVSLIGVRSDQIVPLEQLRELEARLSGPTRFHVLHSNHGHDAFLKEHEEFRPLLRLALEGGCHG